MRVPLGSQWIITTSGSVGSDTFDRGGASAIVEDGQFSEGFARAHPSQNFVALDDFELTLGRYI